MTDRHRRTTGVWTAGGQALTDDWITEAGAQIRANLKAKLMADLKAANAAVAGVLSLRPQGNVVAFVQERPTARIGRWVLQRLDGARNDAIIIYIIMMYHRLISYIS